MDSSTQWYPVETRCEGAGGGGANAFTARANCKDLGSQYPPDPGFA